MTWHPLSLPSEKFKGRTVYVWLLFFTMLFSGGMIPTYIVVNSLGLINTIWALILPCAVNVFNIILLLNFFAQIPSDISDAATIDGAGHIKILMKIYLPLSKASIATIALLFTVQHWNAWFDGAIYIRKAALMPLQTYLKTLIIDFDNSRLSPEEILRLQSVNSSAVTNAQIIIATIPILLVYPLLQKHFVKGINLGGVKG